MGRRPKPEAERLSEPVKIRLTRPQLDALYVEAHRLRVSLSELVRDRLFVVVQKAAGE